MTKHGWNTKEEIDPIIRFADRIAEKEIPLGGEWAAEAGDACFTTVLVPYRDRKPEVKVKYMNAFAEGAALGQNQATALEVSVDGSQDYICIHHRSVQVQGYLDHTGNLVNDKLIKKPTGCNEFIFKDTVFHDDVVVIEDTGKRGYR